MAVYVTETLPDPCYRWTDPPAILSCDAPRCDAPWIAADGLVSWRITGASPSETFWSDRFVVGCDIECLEAAQRRHGLHAHWSAPMPVRDWLDALRDSLLRDPRTTPIGEYRAAGAA